MSKELPGLDIEEVYGEDAYIYHWLPRSGRKETNQPITTFVIGLYPTFEGRYHPVELDLTRAQVNNVFIVGDQDSEKQKFIRGIAYRESLRIAPKYLKIRVLSDPDESNSMEGAPFLKKHSAKNDTASFPNGYFGEKILQAITKDLEAQRGPLKTINLDPSLFVIENLGRFIVKTADLPERQQMLKNILAYKGRIPHLTASTVNFTDLPLLEKNGIGPNLTQGIWLFGKSEKSQNAELEHLYPGGFKVWDAIKKAYSQVNIIGFES